MFDREGALEAPEVVMYFTKAKTVKGETLQLRKCTGAIRKYDRPIERKMAFNRILPEKGVTSYMQSKSEAERYRKHCFSAITQIESLRSSSAAAQKLESWMYLQKQEDILNNYREKLLEQTQFMDHKWAALNEKRKLLIHMFKKYNKFIGENNDKRQRAEKKLADELEIQKSRNEEIAKLQRKQSFLMLVKYMFEERIKQLRMYEDFLQSLAGPNPIAVDLTYKFNNVNDIIRKYESLMDSKLKLLQQHKHYIEEYEALKVNYAKLVENRTLTLIGLTTRLDQMRERYDVAYSRSLDCEIGVANIFDAILGLKAESYQIRDAIWNLYLRINKKERKSPKYSRDNFKQQLLYVKKYLNRLQKLSAATIRHSRTFRAEVDMWSTTAFHH